MMKTIFVMVLLLGTGLAEQAKAPAQIKIPEKTALAIRDQQVKVLVLQEQIRQLQDQIEPERAKLTALVTKAFEDQKVDKQKYTLDDNKWEFVEAKK